jgi:exosortase/archaeosortase family protein
MRQLIQKLYSDKKLLNVVSFVAKVLLVYLVWKILFWLCNREGTFLNGIWVAFTDWFAYKTIQPAAFVLRHVLGYDLVYNHRNIIISGTPGLYLANHCLGVSVCVIFFGFIVSYKGRWQHKLWYIPVGILCIYAINVLRLTGLGVVESCCYERFFALAHTRVYLLMSYGMFFLLIVFWMNYLAKK